MTRDEYFVPASRTGTVRGDRDAIDPDRLSKHLSAEDTVKLLAAVQELSTVHALPGVMTVVRRWARELSGADGVTFILRDGDQCYYADENAIGPLWKGRRFPIQDCISGWAMVHRQAVVIPDIAQDPRIPVDAYRPTFVKSLAMVPVRQENPIAAIGAYWASQHTATARELTLLQTLANATSIALANVELLLDVRHERDRFVQLTEVLPQLVWTAGVDGKARHLNRRWGEFTGLSVEQSRGDGWQGAVHPEDLPALLERWRATARDGSFFEAQCRMRRADGVPRWMLVQALPVQQEGHLRERVGTCTDIHVQKESEQAKAEAIRVRDEFLSVASHELKTPLTALQLQMQGLLEVGRRGRAEEHLLLRLERASRQVERLSGLVEQLLDVSAFTTGRLTLNAESFDLREIVREVADRFRDAARHAKCDLSIGLPDAPLVGTWDRLRLDQLLNNLVSNALKYGAGKPVVVALEEPSPARALLRVADQGIGINAQDQARIFACFERAAPIRHYGGLGLGLFIADRIVLAHGGRMSVDSAVGNGATFTVELPRTAPPASSQVELAG